MTFCLVLEDCFFKITIPLCHLQETLQEFRSHARIYQDIDIYEKQDLIKNLNNASGNCKKMPLYRHLSGTPFDRHYSNLEEVLKLENIFK